MTKSVSPDVDTITGANAGPLAEPVASGHPRRIETLTDGVRAAGVPWLNRAGGRGLNETFSEQWLQ